MYYTTNYYYRNGQQKVLIARLIYNGEKIYYEILSNLDMANIPGMTESDFEAHLASMIHLPILRYELRAKTLPQKFTPIHPNSLEHFLSIPCDSEYFRFSPVKKSAVI